MANWPKKTRKTDFWFNVEADFYEVQGTAEDLLKFSKCKKSQAHFKKTAIFVYVITSKLELLLNYDTDKYDDCVFISQRWKPYEFKNTGFGQLTFNALQNAMNIVANRP